MIKLIDLLKEVEDASLNKILIPRRSKEERAKNWNIELQKQIQQYIKNGSKGNLNLNNTPITSLPAGLIVGGSLYLYNTQITSLPADLKVEGYLDLRSTQITSLPAGLKVGGNLDLNDTPLSKKYTIEQIKAMVPGVKGKIYY